MTKQSQRMAASLRKREGQVSPLALTQGHGAALFGVALAGMLISLYLTYAHYRLRVEPGWQSICAISSTLNCDAVVSSPYGSLLGAPLSAFGIWFYVLSAVVALVGLRGNPWGFPRSPAVVLFLASAYAAVLSIALAALSVLWVGSVCLLCLALYAVNLSMLVIAWRALRSTGERILQALCAECRYWRSHRTQAAWCSGGALAVLVVIPFFYSQQSAASSSSVCDAVAAATAERPATPLTLVVYSDFQCPHCRTLDRALRPLRGNAGLQIVPRHYPLDSACNPRVKQSRHPGACLQARAAICAGTQGRYDEFSDHVFDDAPVNHADLVALAVSLRLHGDRFESCLWSEGTTRQLTEDIAAAIAAGVRGTPTLFVNGRRHAGQLSNADLICLARGNADGGEGIRRRTNP